MTNKREKIFNTGISCSSRTKKSYFHHFVINIYGGLLIQVFRLNI